jgi:MarR family transcriptional regulator, organic hydroperoxide resistance regulator
MVEKVYNIDESLGFWVYRMHTQRVAVLRRAFQAAGYDLTPEQWGLMVRLGEHEGMNQSKLGEKAFKDRHNTTRILNQLVKRGYVERRPDERDKRAFCLFLTESGRIVQRKLIPIVLKHYTSAFSGLTDKDLLIMLKILQHVVGNLEKMPI